MRSQLILKRSTMHQRIIKVNIFHFFPPPIVWYSCWWQRSVWCLGEGQHLWQVSIDQDAGTFHLTWCVFGSILDVVVVIQDGVVQVVVIVVIQVVVIVVVNVVVHVVVAGWLTALSRPPYQRPSPSPSPSWSPSCAGSFRCKPGLIIHDVVVILTKVNCQFLQVLSQHWRCWCDPLHSG